jgi:hypothetical protein
MIVMLQLNHQPVSILEKSHYFFIFIGDKLFDIPFPNYGTAYDWAKRVTKNRFNRDEDRDET